MGRGGTPKADEGTDKVRECDTERGEGVTQFKNYGDVIFTHPLSPAPSFIRRKNGKYATSVRPLLKKPALLSYRVWQEFIRKVAGFNA